MRMRAGWLCAGAVVLSWQAAAATAEPGTLLVQAADAARTVNFRGVLLYRGDRAMEVLRVTHRFKNGHEDEHIVTLNGEPRELIRRDSRLICILPRDRQFSFEQPAIKGLLDQLTPQRVQALQSWYEFHDLGSTRIAGRPCQGVAIVPRDQYRYGYQVWADAQTHLPLRVNLLGGNGRLLEQVMFTEIQYPQSIPDSAFKAKVDTSKFKVVTRNLGATPPAPASAAASAETADTVRWRFQRLPPGFEVTLRDDRELPDGGGRVQHILISDGLSAISVFAAPAPATQARRGFSGLSRVGAVEAYGRFLDGFHITVVGEAPDATVRMIGDSIQREVIAPTAAESAAPP